MTTYKITSKAGIEFGEYEGATPEDAIREMHSEAGYATDEAIESALGKSFGELASELIVKVAS